MVNTNFDVFASKFAQDVFQQKYSKDGVETWSDTSKRVVESVCSQLLSSKEKEKIYNYILERKFIPGGRYLYSAGRPFHQTNNCFLLRAEDSREGWAEAMQKATACLMTGGGIGFEYSNLRPKDSIISRTGGKSTGSLALMAMINEAGRYIMQGGSRRSAIWAGLRWNHGDIKDFLNVKNHNEELKQMKLKDINFHLPMELTNISVVYDTQFFIAIENEEHPLHQLAKEIWHANCLQAFSTAEPGMSFNFRKDNESLRNACLPGFAPLKIGRDAFVTMEEVKIGDLILDGNGQKTKVVKKWDKGEKQVYNYVTDKGESVFCTEDHKVISFLGEDKIEIELCYRNDISIKTENGMSKIKNKINLGTHKVYDIMVAASNHSFISGGVVVSNCTEVTSDEDSDKCNLGTIWMNRIKDKKELADVVKYSTLFLLCGGIYSDVPTEKIRQVGLKNNRIGLGLGGIHEWLMARKQDYEVIPELHKWLSIYEQESDSAAFIKAKELNVSVPKGVRAIAPTGSIGIIAESTTGIEPLFCKAYKRRYLKENGWVYQYVVDGSVKRLIDKGIKVEQIKDAFDISFKQRVKFQADVQNYVDMAISSTCNVPKWGSEENNIDNLEEKSEILLKYAKRLRGFTVYPDESRGGQPLTRVSLEEALANEGTVFEEKELECVGGVCGL